MSVQPDEAKVRVGRFAERIRQEMIPLNSRVSYFYTSVPIAEEDLKEYLEEPISALPPAISTQLPKVSILLVPYLEKNNGTGKGAEDLVSFEKPPENRISWACRYQIGEEAVLAFALRDQAIADYHYHLYHLLATLTAGRWAGEAEKKFSSLLRDELNGNVHGEVDEESWRMKQGLLRRQSNIKRETKVFREYALQSFVDTLTLYLHGICCDIDVETGPRQIASLHLRRRLEVLASLYPPPAGYAVFPEDVKK